MAVGGGGDEGAGTAAHGPDKLAGDRMDAVTSELELGLAPAKPSGLITPAKPSTSTAVALESERVADAGGGSRLRRGWRQVQAVWYSLPTACKALQVWAVFNAVLMIIYSIVAVALPANDEQVHISVIIVITSLFIVYTVADAILYENTFELATSIALGCLVLARVTWFAVQHADEDVLAFKIAWGTLLAIAQTVYIVLAVLSYRQFGWRLYSKLGVDHRERGAASRMHAALVMNGYHTLLKLDAMLLVILVSLGFDIAFEKRSVVDWEILGVNVAGLVVGTAGTACAAWISRTGGGSKPRLAMLLLDIVMPLSLAQPIAFIVLYNIGDMDVANARTSVNVTSGFYLATHISCWLLTHYVVRKVKPLASPQKHLVLQHSGSHGNGERLLAPLHQGAWLGKPTARNPRKLRFFQLSHDGSTLRWGWRKFVRMYYAEELVCSEGDLTISISFALDPELTLKFRDLATYRGWARGLDHLMLQLLAPDLSLRVPSKPSPERHLGSTRRRPTAAAAVPKPASSAAASAVLATSLPGVQQHGAGDSPWASPRAADGGGGAPSPASIRWTLLRDLGVRMRSLRRMTNLRGSEVPEGSSHAGSISSRLESGTHPKEGSGSAASQRNISQADAADLQLQKRARMAAYLQAAARQLQQQRQQQNGGAAGEQPQMEDALVAAEQQHEMEQMQRAALAAAKSDVRRSRSEHSKHTSRDRAAQAASAVETVSVAVQTDESELQAMYRQQGQQMGTGMAGSSSSASSRRQQQQQPIPLLVQRQRQQQQQPQREGGGELVQEDSETAGVAAAYMQAMMAPQQHVHAAAADGTADVAAAYLAAMLAAQQAEEREAAAAPPPPAQSLQLGQGAPEGDATADVAAAYMAAMLAAQQGAGPGPQSPPPPSQQQQAESRQVAPDSTSDVAAAYMAAMMQAQAAGAAGGGSASAVAASGGSPELQQQQQQGGVLQGEDAVLAAQYAAAMGAAGAWQQQQQQPDDSSISPASPNQPPGWLTPRGQPGGVSPLPSLGQRLSGLSSMGGETTFSASTAATERSSRGSQLLPGSLGAAAMAGLPGSLLAISVDVIDIAELSFGKMLGMGSEAAVYAAWFLESPVAVKKFEKAEDSLHEVQMYLRVGSHDNVVGLRGLCQHEGSMYLVLEYCPRGTLDVMLHHSAKQQWDPYKLLPIVRSIARGMHYLHSRKILHRDLKPANIFVGHGQMMKIGDFGMSRSTGVPAATPPQLRRLTPSTLGTLQYSAPELLNEELRPGGPDELAWALRLDVWSFGVTLWEVLERKRPFEGMSQMAVQGQWLLDPYQARLPPVHLPEHASIAAKRVFRGLSDLVEDCTRLDPFSRPTFGDILRRLKSLGGPQAATVSIAAGV